MMNSDKARLRKMEWNARVSDLPQNREARLGDLY